MDITHGNRAVFTRSAKDNRNCLAKGLVRSGKAWLLHRMFRPVILSCLAAAVLSLALAGGGCGEPGTPGATAAADSAVVLVVADDSATVLELTRRQHRVECRNTAMGAFVTGIDTLRAGGQAYWVYSVNGTTPDRAADKFLAAPGDTIRWRLRKVQ